ncbi:MAG: hypothetical protein WB816_07475 [Methylocystis sp.]
MKHVTVKSASLAAGACLSAYALLGASLAYAGSYAPAPLVGVVGGPAGLAAAGVAFGGYLLIKRFRNRG